MNKFKFAASVTALLLQSLVYAGSSSSASVSVHRGSASLDGAHPAVTRAEARWNNSLILDDVQREECDPEDDCPRPSTLRL